tara:strand:+ start:1644 stop:1811 length:168 start_codon:yes stop_codon:yes gene_type:complete
MNTIEKEQCEVLFGTHEDVTMEDYFNQVHTITSESIDNLKEYFKQCYPDETNWSF